MENIGTYGQQQFGRAQINTGVPRSFQDRLPPPVQNAYGSFGLQKQQPISLNNNLNDGDDDDSDLPLVSSSLTGTFGNQQQQQPAQLFGQQKQQGDFISSFGQQQKQPFFQQSSRLWNDKLHNFQGLDNSIDDSFSQQPQQQLIRPMFSIKPQSSGFVQQPLDQSQSSFNGQNSIGQQQLVRPMTQFNTQPFVHVQQPIIHSSLGDQPRSFNTQQQGSFVSSFNQDQQQPVSSMFAIQSRQQDNLPPVITTFSASSPQRVISSQQKSSDSSSSGW